MAHEDVAWFASLLAAQDTCCRLRCAGDRSWQWQQPTSHVLRFTFSGVHLDLYIFCSVSVWTIYMHACRTKNICWLLCCYVMQSDYLRNFPINILLFGFDLNSINILMIDIFTTDKLLANCSMCLVFKSISRMYSPSTCSADRELWVVHSARSSAWQTMFSKFPSSNIPLRSFRWFECSAVRFLFVSNIPWLHETLGDNDVKTSLPQ